MNFLPLLQPCLAFGALGLALSFAGCDEQPSAETQPLASRVVSTTPQGSAVSDGLSIQRVMPEQLYAGSSNQYTLKVSNEGESALHNVVVYESTSPNFTLPDQADTSSSDQSEDEASQQSKHQYKHQVGTLMAGESRDIQVNAQLAEGEQIEICTWATYDVVECNTFKVVNPELVLFHEFVDADGNVINQAYKCDDVFIRYRLMNRGTGEIPSVVVMEQLPTGLVLIAGAKTQQEVEVGLVEAQGEVTSELFKVDMEQVEQSQITARAVATGARVGEVADTSTLRILQPELAFEVSAPQQQYIGREVQMQVSLRNDGDAPLRDVRVLLPVPEDARRFSVSRGDVVQDDEGGFALESLAAGESRNFTVSFVVDEPRDYKAPAVATGYCVAAVERPVSMSIVGIPALQVEVIDSQDPVQVGQQTTYQIRLLNEGSADDLGISITGELPSGFSFVSAAGEPKAQANGRQLTFPTLEKLGPGEERTMQITVRADEASQGKLKLNVKSKELSQTLREEEPTTSY